MLLGLCLGWIFGILSFHKDKDVVFQLSFGLVNGLQVGIFSNIEYILTKLFREWIHDVISNEMTSSQQVKKLCL